MPCDNLTVDTGLSNGSWPIYVGFCFVRFSSGFSSGFCWAPWSIYVGFLSCFLGRVGPIYVGFWLGFRGFSWVFVGFRGFSWFLGCECGWKGGGGGGGLMSLLFFLACVFFVRSWHAELPMYIIPVFFSCHVPGAIGYPCHSSAACGVT